MYFVFWFGLKCFHENPLLFWWNRCTSRHQITLLWAWERGVSWWKMIKSHSPQDKCDAERFPQTWHELFKTICYRTGAEKGSGDILGFSASVQCNRVWFPLLQHSVFLHEHTAGFTSSRYYLAKSNSMQECSVLHGLAMSNELKSTGERENTINPMLEMLLCMHL